MLARVSISARVAIFATLLAAGSLCVLGYVQLSLLSTALTRATQEQSVRGANQLAGSIAGLSPKIVEVIPADRDGLDGIIIFDANGKVLGAGGGAQATLRGMSAEARTVARSGRLLMEFRVPQGGTRSTPAGRLLPWSSDTTLLVAMVPRDGGALATIYHVGWATERLHSTMVSTALNLGGGAAFLCFALLLMLGRLVTRPLRLLAAEVSHMGEGNLDATLSPQRSPELRQLAADTSQMRDDLLSAVRDSNTDPLTGVANHRGFHERLTAVATAAQLDGSPVALIAIDLDNLKLLNDQFGHQAGDRIIQAVAGAIAGTCRPEDLCGRVGGDEFSVICAGVDLAGGEAIAQRIAAAVRTISLADLAGPAAHTSGLVISVSTGVSDMPGSSSSQDEIVVHADAALYAAKAMRSVGRRVAPCRLSRRTLPLRACARAAARADRARHRGRHRRSRRRDQQPLRGGRRMRRRDRRAARPGRLRSWRACSAPHSSTMRARSGCRTRVLLKPGPLTPEERTVMQRHSALGYRIMLAAGLPEREALWVLHHHEHIDGSGYPHGLRGDEIPLASRILLVADAFQAMTAARPYRAARSPEAALAELRRCAGTQFDRAAVDALTAVVADKPPSSCRRRSAAVVEGPHWRLSEGVAG